MNATTVPSATSMPSMPSMPAEFDEGRLVRQTLSALRAPAERIRRLDGAAAQVDRALADAARVELLLERLSAPLVIALFGGSGTGKSTLCNALAGREVSAAGRARPTTLRPVAVTASPQFLDRWTELDAVLARDCEEVVSDRLSLPEAVLLDLPDPDTSEIDDGDSNTARLRALLPFCDVLLIVGTQQKYRCERVKAELAAARLGTEVRWIQTHADCDDDIRDDWRANLDQRDRGLPMYFLDAKTACRRAVEGLPPEGEFARLVEDLRTSFARREAKRLRRDHVVDLLGEAVACLHAPLAARTADLQRFRGKIADARRGLAEDVERALREELGTSRQAWEMRLLEEVIRRWGFSPFGLVLQTYHQLGWLISSTMLARVRSPGQLVLWGAYEGTRQMLRRTREHEADGATAKAVSLGWNETTLGLQAAKLQGDARAAGLELRLPATDELERQLAPAATEFLDRTSRELTELVAAQGAIAASSIRRTFYDGLLAGAGLLVLGRWAWNFFLDSWLLPTFGYQGRPLYGLDFFVHAVTWLLVCSGALLGLFLYGMRRRLEAVLRERTVGRRPEELAARFFDDWDAAARELIEADAELTSRARALARLRPADPSLDARPHAPDPDSAPSRAGSKSAA